ncbi:hypothetical protein [Microbacterium arborescens]|uniref:hypothetical protein n=1 Tax=Microbacterium arborescens TaxID=33883 RepID=UPI000ADD25F3|nr:hypothetical protein [Microbacterium arborescens]
MDDLAVYAAPSDRWLGEFLTSAALRYRTSAEYRRRLHLERAPLFAHPPHRAA